MSYTITITDPTPEEARKVIAMLNLAASTTMTAKGTPISVEIEASGSGTPSVAELIELGHLIERIGSQPPAPVVPPSVAEFAGSEIERLAEEQERDLRVRYFYHPESDSYFTLQPGQQLGDDADSQLCVELEEADYLARRPEPTLSELSADPSVFTASPQAPAGAPSFAAVAPAPTAPEVPPATLTAPSAPSVPVPPPAAPAAVPSAPATPSAVALDANGLPWDARIHSSSKEKVKAGTWKYRRGVDDAAITQVEAELRQLMAIPAPAPAPVATPAPAPVVPAPPVVPPAPAAVTPPGVVLAMNIINPLIAARKADTPAILAKLADMGLKTPSDFTARPDLLPEFQQWADSL